MKKIMKLKIFSIWIIVPVVIGASLMSPFYTFSKVANADIGEFCINRPENAYSSGTVIVDNTTQRTNVTASGNSSNDTQSIDANIGDSISIILYGSTMPPDAEGTVDAIIEADGTTLLSETVIGDYSTSYEIPAITAGGYASIIATACQTTSQVTVYININTPPGPSFTCDVTQTTATVDAGSDTAYTINTAPVNGFSSPVNFTASVSPSATSTPDVSFTNNGQTPAAVTTANVTTTSNTSVSTYTITFTGTGGSYSTTCGTQLIVNPAQGDFELVIQPSTGILPNTNPNRVNIGTNAVFTVFAECTGGFSGTITNMSATTTFTGPVATLGSSSLACGATTTLTISNTGSIPEAQQSTINQILSEAISVTGSAQL